MATEVENTPPVRRRSRAGCWTCRSPAVKKRCDQQRLVCGRCERLNLQCDYAMRPTLAERRRANRSTSSALSTLSSISNGTSPATLDSAQDTFDSPSATETFSASPASSHLTGSIKDGVNCSLDLCAEDYEAIHYFRTEFAKLHHTKNPEYSLISLMFKLAQAEPMIMHMVVAIGHQEMGFRQQQSSASAQHAASNHYGLALRLMADAIIPSNAATKDLDTILTALWLMLLYEQQFGDERCRAYLSHLQGVASLLQSQSGSLLQIPPHKLGILEKDSAAVLTNQSSAESKISIYAARVLIWIVLLDAAAATSGVGGHVNEAIINMLLSNPTDSRMRSKDPIKAVARLHHYSNSLYRLAWGDAYPQAELVDDVENRNVYALLGHCAYLRYLTAQLATMYRDDPTLAMEQAHEVEYSIDEVGDLFRELMEVAHELSLGTDNSHRLVANMRAIVPMYYAIVLDFKRLTAFDQPKDERQRHALQEIMNLCFQDFTHGGDQPNLRIAWPLFMAALETEDMLHQKFILDRFETFRLYGKNYERAHRFLVAVLPMQRRNGKRVDIRLHMEHNEMFVLG
ncbi:fungal-specific transcription factor domain-containing protein [Boeremia exigua]|uniref:fungal-specific transcription factor domain-containing protein n=1 Tax=Boeremia exigua TaxID=749465 RepID=UPI001E8D7C3A|nr:fungal-specific transcription factor domain-containing protein [Boeremia exigua]KAH6639816.1 fungal-specific transcription factor domain-containing protein [Boeremia exigua]